MNHIEEALLSRDAAKDQDTTQGSLVLINDALLHATLALVQEQRTANLLEAYSARLGTDTEALAETIKNRLGLNL